MIKTPASIEQKLEQRKLDTSFRSLTTQSDLIDFSSNDYLGFSRSSTLFDQTHAFLIKNKIKHNGSTGSRLLTGNHSLYEKAEKLLAQFHQSDAALIYNSGYDANIGLLSSVPQRGDFIFYDEYIHASIRDGIRLSNAKAYKFLHNDIADLKRQISKIERTSAAIYIVTESIFSMDGDAPDLKELVDLAQLIQAHLIIDEAHATGVIGNHGVGLVQKLKLEDRIFARVHTFGKGLGCHGAVVLGAAKLKEYLINFSRSFIYTTGLAPHSLAAILMSYQHLEKTDAVNKLNENIAYFNTQIHLLGLEFSFIKSDSSIHCCIIEGNKKVKAISQELVKAGFDVKAILPPTVPKNKERLRFCLHSFNTFAEISSVLQLLKSML